MDIKPLRQYGEHDVINLYAFGGTISTVAGSKVSKGTIVKVQGDGWKNTDEPQDMIGSVGASYNGTVSQRYGVNAKVTLCASGETPLGMMLHSVAEVDENGELLKFNPRKAAQMEVSVSGQAVPILTKGIVLYKGALTDGAVAGNVAVYATADGELTTTAASHVKVGKTLGAKDTDGYVLLKIEL